MHYLWYHILLANYIFIASIIRPSFTSMLHFIDLRWWVRNSRAKMIFFCKIKMQGSLKMNTWIFPSRFGALLQYTLYYSIIGPSVASSSPSFPSSAGEWIVSWGWKVPWAKSDAIDPYSYYYKAKQRVAQAAYIVDYTASWQNATRSHRATQHCTL